MAYDDKNAYVKEKGRLLMPAEILHGVLNDAQNAIRIDGTISVGPSVGASTEAKQDSQITLETAIRDRLISGGPQTGSGVVTATTQRVTLASDGPAVTALSNIDADIGAPADAAATGTSNGSLIALTKQVRANTASIDGKMPALVSGRQPVDGSGVTQPISAAALPLPAGAATAALQMPISTTASGNITTQNLVPAGVATAGSAVELVVGGLSNAQVQVTGTYTGALSLQSTLDGTNWLTVGGSPFFNTNTGTSLATITSALQSIFKVDISGMVRVRVTGLAAMTGTATVTIVGAQGSTHVNATMNSGLNAPVNVAQINGTTVSTNRGAAGTGSQRVAVAAATHSAASTEPPVLVGGFVTSTLDTTLVQGDVAQLSMTTAGQAITKGFASSENDWQYAAASGGITNTTTAVTIRAAGAASIRNYLTGITVSADALGAATELVVRDGASGTVIWRVRIPTAGLPTTNITFPTPLRGTAATLMEVATLTATVTGGVYFNAQGYQSF